MVQAQLEIAGLVKGHRDRFLGDPGQDPGGQLTAFTVQTHNIAWKQRLSDINVEQS